MHSPSHPHLPSKLITESTSSALTSRSLSLRKQFIAIVTPALYPEPRMRHPHKLKMEAGRQALRPAILPLQEVIAKTVPDRCNKRRPAIEKQRNGGCGGGQRLKGVRVENQEAFESGLDMPWTRDEWRGSSPSSPINRLLLDSFMGRSIA